ncbi:MAG: hypothetical protein R3293_19965 [Candidatus Promineifilaceae bacterium]|nr:hypothetical protein [Candidatus Promineifilaceae bacterium]
MYIKLDDVLLCGVDGMAITIREQLHNEIDQLPDDIVRQIADFALFLKAKRQISPSYADWNPDQWPDFVLENFFVDDDEVEYSLRDAREIYRP